MLNRTRKKVLITGGAGFIGSHLALKLHDLNYEVTVLDNLSEQVHGKRGDSDLYSSIKDKARFIKRDVRNREGWLEALSEQEIVVHLAAETGTGQSMYEVEKYIDVNVKGTAILLDILVKGNHGINKVVVASSRAIYGEGKYVCKKDGVVYPGHRKDHDMAKKDFEVKCPICNENAEMAPTSEDSRIHPSSVYGITKQNQEQMILTVCSSIGLPAVALRYQNVYGPGQSLSNPYTGILSIFSTRIKNGNPINIFEDGKESRDFVYIEDAVDATVLAIEKEEANGDVFNVGSGSAATVLEVARTLKKQYRVDIPIEINGNYRLGDIRHNVADLDKIKRKLGFSPAVSFLEGITKFAEWVEKQDIQDDAYEMSINEMRQRGVYK